MISATRVEDISAQRGVRAAQRASESASSGTSRAGSKARAARRRMVTALTASASLLRSRRAAGAARKSSMCFGVLFRWLSARKVVKRLRTGFR